MKSLLGYAKRIGYLDFDPAKLIRNARPQSRISERILSGEEVRLLIAAAPLGRDRLLLQTLYYAGLRVAEVCSLAWKDLREQPDGSALASITGKGARLRIVGLPADLWQNLKALRGNASGNSPVFASRKGNGYLSRSQVLRIVQRAAKAAGIDRNVSAHWLRHSHATHAIENGAPLHLVRDTLGHANLATTSLYLHARPGESSGLYLP